MDSFDESKTNLYSSLFCAYNQLIEVSPDTGYSIHVKDGSTLLTVKFGELVWLCKILEAASEKYKANYKVSNFNYTDKSFGNITRFYELLNICEITVPPFETVQQYVNEPFTNDAIEFFTSLLTDLTTIFEEVSIKPKDKRNATGLPPTAPTPQRAKYARSAVQSPSNSRSVSSTTTALHSTSVVLGSPNQASVLRYGNSTGTNSNRNTPLRSLPDTPNTQSSLPRSTTKTPYVSNENLNEPPTPSRSTNGGGGGGSLWGGALSFFADKAMSLTTGMTTADVDRLSQDKKTLEETLQRFIARAQEADRKERMWESLLARQETDAKQKEDKLLAENAKQARQLNELKQSIDQIRMGADEATRNALVKREELFGRLDTELSITLTEKQSLQNKVIELEASLNEAHKANERTYNEYTQQIQHLTAKLTDISENRGKVEADNVRYEKEITALRKEYQERMDQVRTDGSDKLYQETEKVKNLQTQLESLQMLNQQLQNNLSSQNHHSTEIEEAYKTINTQYTVLQDKQQHTFQQARTALTSIRSFRSDMDTFRSEMANQLTSTFQDFTQQANTLSKRIKQAEKDAEEANKRYYREQAERRHLHNKLSELRGNIRVFARIRPFLGKENETVPIVNATGNQELVVAESVPEGGLTINSKGRVLESKTYEFDRVFGAESTQEQVFDEISPMVTSALDGYHSCIFAYGQTGSGKTFTMEGPVNNRGVYFRALAELFHQIQERCMSKEWSFTVRVSMVEIYNECVVDLLGDKPTSSYDGFTENSNSNSMNEDNNISMNNASSFGSTNSSTAKTFLEIKQGPNGNYLPDAHVVEVSTQEEVEALMVQGAHNRSVGRTNANEHSSRSHSLLMLEIVGKNTVTNASSSGKLVLVDLAGSERVSKTGATGQRLEEAKNINQSLSALNSVIHALQIKQKHIPFRDSKLTYLLADSLGKDNKTLMIVQVSPSVFSRGETLCSLDFASRARKVELGKAVKHGDSGELLRSKNEIKRLQELSTKSTEEIETLKHQLQTLMENERTTLAKYTEATTKIGKLEAELQSTHAVLAKTNKSVTVDSNEMEAMQAEIASVLAENQALKEDIETQKSKTEAAVKEAIKQTTMSTKAVSEKEMNIAIKKAIDETNEKARIAQNEAVKRAVAEVQREKENRQNNELETLRKRIRDLQASLERADAKSKEEIQAAKRTWEREKIKNARTASNSTTNSSKPSAVVNGSKSTGTTNSRKQSLTTNVSNTTTTTNFNSTTGSLTSSVNLNSSGYLPDNFSVNNNDSMLDGMDNDNNSVLDQSSIDENFDNNNKDEEENEITESVPNARVVHLPTDEVTETIEATRALLNEIKVQMGSTGNEYPNTGTNNSEPCVDTLVHNNVQDNNSTVHHNTTTPANDSFTINNNASLDASAIIHSMTTSGNNISTVIVPSAVKLPIQYIQSPFEQLLPVVNSSTIVKNTSMVASTPGGDVNASYLLFHDSVLPTPSEMGGTTPAHNNTTNMTNNGSMLHTPATILAASYFASPDLLMFPNKACNSSSIVQNDIVNHAITDSSPSSSNLITSTVEESVVASSSLLDLPPSQNEFSEQQPQQYSSPVFASDNSLALETNGMNMTPMVKSLSNSFLHRSSAGSSSTRTPITLPTVSSSSSVTPLDQKTDDEIEQDATEEFQLAELNASGLTMPEENGIMNSCTNDNSVILSGKKRARGGTPFKNKPSTTEIDETIEEINNGVPLNASTVSLSNNETETVTTPSTVSSADNLNDDGTFHYGSRERARLLGIPSPKPIGILKRKKLSNDKGNANNLPNETMKSNEEEGTVTRGRRRNVALVSPETSTVHMIKAEEEAEKSNNGTPENLNTTESNVSFPPVTLRSSTRSATTSTSPGPNKSSSRSTSSNTNANATSTTTLTSTTTTSVSRSGSVNKQLNSRTTTLSRTASNNTLSEQSGNTDNTSTGTTPSKLNSTTTAASTTNNHKRGAVVAAVPQLPEAQKKSKTSVPSAGSLNTVSSTSNAGTSSSITTGTSVSTGPARVKVEKENNGGTSSGKKINGTSTGSSTTTMKGGATRVAVSNNSSHGARRV